MEDPLPNKKFYTAINSIADHKDLSIHLPLWSGFTIPSASSRTLISNLSSNNSSMDFPFLINPSATNMMTGSGLLIDTILERWPRIGELVGDPAGVRSSLAPSEMPKPREVLPPLGRECLEGEWRISGVILCHRKQYKILIYAWTPWT